MKVTCNCEDCGKEFAVSLSRFNVGRGKYCSKACFNIAKSRKRTIRSCEEYGKEFTATLSEIGKYCSRSCMGKAYSKIHLGSGMYGIPSMIDGKKNPDWVSKRRTDNYGNYRLLTWKNQGVSIDTYGQFLTLLAMAGYKCEICDTELDEKTAYLDHDHDTGKVRGIACTKCNLATGLMPQPATLIQAANYIIRNQYLY